MTFFDLLVGIFINIASFENSEIHSYLYLYILLIAYNAKFELTAYSLYFVSYHLKSKFDNEPNLLSSFQDIILDIFSYEVRHTIVTLIPFKDVCSSRRGSR